MPSDHPFQHLFETFGKLPEAHSEAVNREARETLTGWLKVPLKSPGHCILLKAPRAGHGKTHLLTKLQHDLGGTHEFVPLRAISGSRIDAATVLDDTLRRLVRGLPAAGGLTVLDLVARRLFSSSLQPLVNSGEVPCQDREGAINALRNRPIETFDFHHPSAVTAHWARENFELLGPRLALELSQRDALSLREVSFWVDAMFRFSATPIDNPARVRALAATVFDNPGAEASAHERLVALLGLLTSLMRVVLVADEVEGFSSDETAALRFASFIGALRQSAERVDLVLSVNEDIWKSAFLPRLSDGLADRLSEVVVELKPLDRAGMLAVLESRSPGSGEEILDQMEAGSIPTHARGLIKDAGNSSKSDPALELNAAARVPAAKTEPAATFAAPVSAEPETAGEEQAAPKSDRFAVAPLRPDPVPEPPKEAEGTPPAFPPAPEAPEEISESSTATESSAGGLAAFERSPESAQRLAPQSEGRFSPEAAIAAFAATRAPEPQPQVAQSLDPDVAQQPIRDFSAAPPASWPSPEVTESPVQRASMFSAEPVSAFQAAPASEGTAPEPPQNPREEAVPALQAPPEPPSPPRVSMFAVAPEPANDAVSAFQAPSVGQPVTAFQLPPSEQPVAADQPPPLREVETATAFQAPPPSAFQSAQPLDAPAAMSPPSVLEAPPAGIPGVKDESSTDRVDDLLRQFRERYGRS